MSFPHVVQLRHPELRAAIMLPLEPRDTLALFKEFRRVGRSVLLGAVLTAMAQGVLAGVGFYVTQVPEAAFFGALTAIASLMPGAGPLPVWVPAGVYLLATGHLGLGLVELLYGALGEVRDTRGDSTSPTRFARPPLRLRRGFISNGNQAYVTGIGANPEAGSGRWASRRRRQTVRRRGP